MYQRILPFQVYNSMILANIMTCATIIIIQFGDIIITPLGFLMPHLQLISISTSSPRQLLSVSKDLPVVDIAYKWNHEACGLSCLASFI